MSDLESDPLVQIGVAGALAREMQADHEVFIQFFAEALMKAFPNEAELKYEGGFLSKKRLVGITIQLGENIYSLFKPTRGPLESNRIHVVRGIALKTESLPTEEWLREISSLIEAKVAKDTAARAALASALGLR